MKFAVGITSLILHILEHGADLSEDNEAGSWWILS